jgi:hypothetical protein
MGSTVELELTDDIKLGCGKGNDALPPSLSTGGYWRLSQYTTNREIVYYVIILLYRPEVYSYVLV